MQQDQIIHATLRSGTVRVVAASARHTVSEAREIHALSRVATAALGRQLIMTAIMASGLKHESERLSTIIKGGGPAGNLVCTGDASGNVKGTVQNPACELPPTAEGKLDVGGFVGASGQLTVVRDMVLRDPYVGTCALVSGEIARDFAEYYLVSEQQPSLVYLGVREHPADGAVRAAGGLLLQPLPGCTEDTIEEMMRLAEPISQMTELLDEGIVLRDVLGMLFVGCGLSVEGESAMRYRCDCSRERIEKALISVGGKDLTEMIEQDNGAEVTCHFCNRNYTFSREELTALLAEAMGANDGDA